MLIQFNGTSPLLRYSKYLTVVIGPNKKENNNITITTNDDP
jgi:hypothetical protein